MRKILLLAALAFASAAHAETTNPRSIGRAHICGRYLAMAGPLIDGERSTILAFDVGTDGKVKNLTVSKASGVHQLDRFAISCASEWLYAPATKDGVPIEVPWTASVSWFEGSHPPSTGPVPSGTHDCTNYTPRAVWDGAQGKTTLSFRIAADGAVNSPAVAESSGNAELDAASLACVASWHYFPAKRGGVATEIDWRAAVEWKTNDVPLAPAPPCERYAAATPEMLKAIGGVTTLLYRVKPDGSVSEVSVLRSSGNDALDRAATRCMTEAHPIDAAQLPAAGALRASAIDWHAR
ncbi:MAG TPA: TonB family protein [Rhizomicrobium sp.]|nr:TonB family protein [Rhizomicrobium sp.]